MYKDSNFKVNRMRVNATAPVRITDDPLHTVILRAKMNRVPIDVPPSSVAYDDERFGAIDRDSDVRWSKFDKFESDQNARRQAINRKWNEVKDYASQHANPTPPPAE